MSHFTRRRFLQTASLAALAAGVPSSWAKAAAADPRFKHLVNPGRKLRIASVGAGGKAYSDIIGCATEDIVALCDVDYATGARAFHEFPLAARYRDFRQMLNEMGDRIDAVIVTTPDHMHFPVALMAIERGKHVYVQKPLTHTIGEARILKQAALKAGVVTQMGNQGHANEGTRLTKEWIEAGVIGEVREVHCWTNRPIWPQGMKLPGTEGAIPPTMDWNLWLGVAPKREYNQAIAPFNWRGYWDYGCGALGDMACHLMDAPFWALNLRGPVKVSAVSEGNSEVTCPNWSVITYEFPARGSLPPLKMVWYDGNKLPDVPPELGAGGKLPQGGVIYRGDKGVILAEGDYGNSPRLIPEERMKDFRNRPPKTIPRVPKADPYQEWIAACKGAGPAPGSNIPEHAADLTELVLLGNVAVRAGQPIDWDPVAGKCVGLPSADRFIHKSYRLF
jgi:predicted dehydrogenase